MVKFLILTFVINIHSAYGVEYYADQASYKSISDLLIDLEDKLGTFPINKCSEDSSSDEATESIKVPLCSFQDICSASRKEDGFIIVNDVKVPDYQMHTKLTQLKNSIMTCYDTLDEIDDNVSVGYRDLFNFSTDSNKSILADILPSNSLKKISEIYQNIDYAEQLRSNSNEVLSSIDLKAYLDVASDISVHDRQKMYLNRTKTHYISPEINLSEEDFRNLDILNTFLSDPSNIDKKNSLLNVMKSSERRKELNAFFSKNNGSKRENLLQAIESKMDMRGFYMVDSVLYNGVSDTDEVKQVKSDIEDRVKVLKTRIIEKFRSRSDLSEEQKQYFILRLENSNISLREPIEDPVCSAGTPGYADGFDFVICPKALSLTPEALDVILGHELSHLIDHCTSHSHSKRHHSVTDSNGDNFYAPELKDSAFKGFNKCLKENKTLAVEVKFNPINPTKNEEFHACNRHQVDHRHPEQLDQTRETFSDKMAMSILSDDIKGMDRDAAERLLVGVAFAKPFKCEENKDFNISKYDEFIGDTSDTLKQYGCESRVSPKLYVENGVHLSMEDRVNHIFMTEDIQKVMGCTKTSIDETGKQFAQENLKCDL